VSQRDLLARALNALQGAYAELDAMMDTYEEYVPSGRLCDEIDSIIADLQTFLAKREDT